MDRLRNISHHHGNCMPFVFSSWWICSSKRLELYWGNKTYQVPLDIRVSNLKGCFQIPTTAHFSLLRNKQHVLSRSRLTPWNSPSEAGTSRASRKDDGSPQRQRPTSALQGFPCSLKHRNCCMAKVSANVVAVDFTLHQAFTFTYSGGWLSVKMTATHLVTPVCASSYLQ